MENVSLKQDNNEGGWFSSWPRVRQSFANGLIHSLDLNNTWVNIYIFVLAIVSFLFTSNFLKQIQINDIVYLFFALGGLLVLAFAKQVSKRFKYHSWARRLIILGPIVSMSSITFSLLSVGSGGLFIKDSLIEGAKVWAVTSGLIWIIALFPGSAFNSDFASLRMFLLTKVARFLSGIFLFIISAQQLIFWPELKTSITNELKTVDALVSSLTSPDIPAMFSWDNVLSTIEFYLAAGLVLYALYFTYVHLAVSIKHSKFPGLFLNGFLLFFRQLLSRIGQKDNVLWPRIYLRNQHMEDVKQDDLLQDFSVTSTFAGVSLLFGLSIPRLVSLNGQEYRLLFLLLVIFVIGGIDIWLATIDVTTKRGISYVTGLWIGTIFIYWPTTLIAILAISNMSPLLMGLDTDLAINLINTFSFAYRFVIAALTLIIGISQLDFNGSLRSSNIFRRGMAISALFLLLGGWLKMSFPSFGDNGTTPISFHFQNSIQNISLSNITVISLSGYITILLALIALVIFPWLRRRSYSRHPLGAQMVIAPSMAVAPLLFNDRITSWSWSEEGFADVTVENVGLTPGPLELRIYLAGSEQEVAWEINHLGKRIDRGPIDFVITDLQTALDIIGNKRRTNQWLFWKKKKEEYKIISVVGVVRWWEMKARPSPFPENQTGFILDSGHILYSSNVPIPLDEDHPCGLGSDSCRQTNFATVAYYAWKCRDDISKVYFPEPYRSWLLRKYREIDGQVLQRQPSKREIYVLLTRVGDKDGHPPVPFNWRRTLCQMIADGQQAARNDQKIVNHNHLHRLHEFLQQGTSSKLDLQLSDIQIALGKCDFISGFPRERFGTYRYQKVLYKLLHNELLSNDQWERLIYKQIQDLKNRDYKILRNQGLSDEQAWAEVNSKEPYHEEEALSALKEPNNEKDVLFLFEKARIIDTHFYKKMKPIPTPRFLHTSYLVPLMMVPISNKPGELARLLSNRYLCGFDFQLLTTINIGDSVLVYLFNKELLPSKMKSRLKKGNLKIGEPLKHGHPNIQRNIPLSDSDGLSTLEGYDFQEVCCMMVPIMHQQGSLNEAIGKLRSSLTDTNEGKNINIEYILAFPINKKFAIALIVVREEDWIHVFRRLKGIEPSVGQARKFVHLPRVSNKLVLMEHFSFKRHQYEAIFYTPKSIQTDADLMFYLNPDLNSFTLGWGTMDNWIAEVDFEEIRLKIPTEFALKLWLRERLHLYKGQESIFERYNKREIWWMRVKPKN